MLLRQGECMHRFQIIPSLVVCRRLETDLSVLRCREVLTGQSPPGNYDRIAREHPVEGRVGPKTFTLALARGASIAAVGSFGEVGLGARITLRIHRRRLGFVGAVGPILLIAVVAASVLWKVHPAVALSVGLAIFLIGATLETKRGMRDAAFIEQFLIQTLGARLSEDQCAS